MLVVAVNIDLFNHAPPSDKYSSVLANTEGFPQRHYIDRDINFMLDCVTLFDIIPFTCGAIMLRVTFCCEKQKMPGRIHRYGDTRVSPRQCGG